MGIAFDAKSTGTTSGGSSSLNYSHACSGADRILIVTTVNHQQYGNVTGVTYGGISMTLVNYNNGSINHGQRIFYLIAPATGANNIVITKSDSIGWIGSIAFSYTGANQSSQPDANIVPSEYTGTSYSRSLTTVVDNTWIVWAMCAFSGSSLTAGSNTHIRQDTGWGDVFGSAMVDTNADQTPAGSKTMTVTSMSQTFASCMVSIKPVSIEAVGRSQSQII